MYFLITGAIKHTVGDSEATCFSLRCRGFSQVYKVSICILFYYSVGPHLLTTCVYVCIHSRYIGLIACVNF